MQYHQQEFGRENQHTAKVKMKKKKIENREEFRKSTYKNFNDQKQHTKYNKK